VSKQRWLQERKQDSYWRKAKEMGLPSRAAFKLEEIQRRWHVIKRGDFVLDLGAAPGGITAVASRLVGSDGLVVAVDVAEMKLADTSGVISLCMDVFTDDLPALLLEKTGQRPFDTIISDLSPRHSGDYELLAVQQLELVERALEIASSCLRSRGNFVVKAFEHPSLRDVETRMKRMFWRFERFVPKATKKRSSEVFLIGLGFRSSEQAPAKPS